MSAVSCCVHWLDCRFAPPSGCFAWAQPGNQPAMAADNKAYPGSICQPFSGAPDIEVDGGNSAIRNASTTNSRTVSCPFVRDNTINTNGTGDLWVS